MKLRYAVENRRGAVLLAGPAGVGKTMLVQLFRGELADTFQPQVHVVFPQMSSRDLLVYLAEQLVRAAGRSAAAHDRGKRPPAGNRAAAQRASKAGMPSS